MCWSESVGRPGRAGPATAETGQSESGSRPVSTAGSTAPCSSLTGPPRVSSFTPASGGTALHNTPTFQPVRCDSSAGM